jgi:hypothetical protein
MTRDRFVVGVLVIVLLVQSINLYLTDKGNTHANNASSQAQTAAHEAKQAAEDSSTAISEVKQSRKDTIINTCNEANERHITAEQGVLALVTQQHRATHTPAKAGETKLLDAFVQALVPHYNCARRVAEQTKP